MDLLSATDWLRHRPGFTYPLAVAFVGLTFLLRLAASDYLSGFPFLSFLPAILLASFIGGAGPGLVAAMLAAFIVQQFFVEPHNIFWPVSAGQWVGLSTYLINAAIIVGLMEMIIIAHERQSRLRNELNSFNTRLEETVVQRTAELRHEMEENAAAQAQVRQLQKMETIGQLTGGVAHDFNNMLAIIIGNLDLAQRRLTGNEDPRLLNSIQNAKDGAQRAAVLTARLLAFSRQQPLAPEVIDLNKLVGGMSELLRRTLGEQIRIETVLAGGLWPSFADLSQLENAILNLAVNARDAMPGGGNLTIETANTELDERYSRMHSEVEAGQYVMISITDTGTGMPPEVLQKVFDPFYTTKPLGQGTGLGLSMIYGFIQQSRGHVVIDSAEGEGTTIQLFLPRHQGAVEAAASIDDEFAPVGAGETVLVIEDDAAVRLLVMQVLEELGYQGIETADGRQAVPILESSRHIDLLISDVGLPGLNGRQLAEIARERRPGLPILFMTGYAKQAADQAAFLEGGMEIIGKPFAIEQLGRRIGEILRRETS